LLDATRAKNQPPYKPFFTKLAAVLSADKTGGVAKSSSWKYRKPSITTHAGRPEVAIFKEQRVGKKHSLVPEARAVIDSPSARKERKAIATSVIFATCPDMSETREVKTVIAKQGKEYQGSDRKRSVRRRGDRRALRSFAGFSIASIAPKRHRGSNT
jgi:hypothetical protein